MNNYQKIIIPIKGMHCKSCEILIEDELDEVKGIKKAKADWHRSEAEIKYEGEQPKMDAIEEAIRRAGYNVGSDEKKSFFSHNKKDYQELGIAIIALAVLYFVLKGLGLTSLSINTSSDLTLPVIMLVGLAAGFSSCMALVGGLVLGISARYSERHPEATAAEKFQPHLFFNSGRLLSYMVLGGVLGLLGSAFQLSSLALGIITIVVGLIMLITGLQLIEIFPWANNFKLALPKGLSRALGMKDNKGEYSHNRSFIMGALTFFLPCGFTQAMQVYAISTGNFISGAMVMGAFALGTMPGLISIGGITSTVKGNFARRFFKFAGIAVIIFSMINISNGLGLTGLKQAYGKTIESDNGNDPNVTLENGTQVVRMEENGSGYSPNVFTIKKDIPVKWIIDAKAPYSCASTILLPKYNIRKNLVSGENTIEFTPTETGRLPFSCSMGMYTGVFNVVDENGKGVAADNTKTVNSPVAASGSCGASGGGCGCGGGGRQYTSTSGEVKTTAGSDTAPAGTKDQVQNISSGFTVNNDITPNTFTVKKGVPVHYVINPTEDGRGCMSAITIQSLFNQIIPIQAGQPIVMDFTPETPGTYLITCAMGVPRGKIIVE